MFKKIVRSAVASKLLNGALKELIVKIFMPQESEISSVTHVKNVFMSFTKTVLSSVIDMLKNLFMRRSNESSFLVIV